MRRVLPVLSISLFLIGAFMFAPSRGFATAPTVSTSGDATYSYPADVILKGSILDQEGGSFTYAWLEAVNGGTQTDFSGSVTAAAGQVFALPDCGVTGLGIGAHTFTLSVTDVSENITVLSTPITITVVDNTAPTLKPEVKPSILWPPNNKPVRVVVTPNASDNSGQAPTLTAMVTSNEPVKVVGAGKKSKVSWDTPIFNKDGTISFMLPAQRLGNGKGRVYTITLTATDSSGNSSIADVTVTVPHDQAKKKK